MRLSTVGASALAAMSVMGGAHAQDISIVTGSEAGVYFVVGNTVADIVNSHSTDLNVTSSTSGGSIANIESLRVGEADFGVAQSDWQFHAINGSARFEGNGFDDLRAVFSVHGEPFTLLARADSGIETFDDLRGKRVNLGNPGSGQRGTAEVLLDAYGWAATDFALAAELTGDEQGPALCAGELDAIFFVAGHPNNSIHEGTAFCDSQLVPVQGPEVAALIAANPFYTDAIVPRGYYASGNQIDTPSFGVRATFVTSATQPDDVVYEIVRTVFENFDAFRYAHPAFELLDPQSMATDGLSAPLHPGAARYYREQGWISES
ncbi:TAXI family TRAP transporter solute-binding subunit [Pontivivens insulae]|uniref:Uncharacterized protein n=1 Tax=Pontivivens insulae TaxID=1639689 RepID=A0A2R8A7J6_9RHOB|nr:TAXI family TRAP transporter solute-binding subunit [Pontivivens insulae]RED18305.1 hypothetical protein DFR53_0500 [Pontivivens insulae]SPF28203.1 hypothetical protein POI8812_00501 [Pontivivens insulae]